jgi:hypothetical protein
VLPRKYRTNRRRFIKKKNIVERVQNIVISEVDIELLTFCETQYFIYKNLPVNPALSHFNLVHSFTPISDVLVHVAHIRLYLLRGNSS